MGRSRVRLHARGAGRGLHDHQTTRDPSLVGVTAVPGNDSASFRTRVPPTVGAWHPWTYATRSASSSAPGGPASRRSRPDCRRTAETAGSRDCAARRPPCWPGSRSTATCAWSAATSPARPRAASMPSRAPGEHHAIRLPASRSRPRALRRLRPDRERCRGHAASRGRPEPARQGPHRARRRTVHPQCALPAALGITGSPLPRQRPQATPPSRPGPARSVR